MTVFTWVKAKTFPEKLQSAIMSFTLFSAGMCSPLPYKSNQFVRMIKGHLELDVGELKSGQENGGRRMTTDSLQGLGRS